MMLKDVEWRKENEWEKAGPYTHRDTKELIEVYRNLPDTLYKGASYGICYMNRPISVERRRFIPLNDEFELAFHLSFLNNPER